MKIKICIAEGCKNVQTTKDFCRLHYLQNWKKIKKAAQKKAVDQLNKYVEGICKKYPERYMDVIRKDLKNGSDAEKPVDETFTSNTTEEIFENLGIHDEDSIDKLISRIKIEGDF